MFRFGRNKKIWQLEQKVASLEIELERLHLQICSDKQFICDNFVAKERKEK